MIAGWPVNELACPVLPPDLADYEPRLTRLDARSNNRPAFGRNGMLAGFEAGVPTFEARIDIAGCELILESEGDGARWCATTCDISNASNGHAAGLVRSLVRAGAILGFVDLSAPVPQPSAASPDEVERLGRLLGELDDEVEGDA